MICQALHTSLQGSGYSEARPKGSRSEMAAAWCGPGLARALSAQAAGGPGRRHTLSRGRPARHRPGCHSALLDVRCMALDVDVRVANTYDEQWASAALRVESFRMEQTADPQLFSKAVEEEFLNIQKASSGALNMTRFETLIATADLFGLPPLDNASIRVDDSEGRLTVVVGTCDLVMMSFHNGGYGRQPSLTAYVANVCVHPEVRRQQVAARLVQEAKDLSLFWGAGVIFVQVESANEAAVRLYEGHGFKETGDLPEKEGLLTLAYFPSRDLRGVFPF